MMAPEEQRVVAMLAEAWNAFVALPALHSADRKDFCDAVHSAQRIVLARPALRSMNDGAANG